MVNYGVGETNPEELAGGLRDAHARLVLAYDNLPRIEGDSSAQRGALAVLDEVEKYVEQAADATDRIAHLDRTKVFLLEGLYAKLQEHCRPAVDEEKGINIELVMQAFVNCSTECFMRGDDEASDPQIMLQDYYDLVDALTPRSDRDAPRSNPTDVFSQPAVKPAQESEAGPHRMPILPGLFDRVMKLCRKYASPAIGMTEETLAAVIVNTALSGQFSGNRSGTEEDEVDLSAELQIYKDLVAQYGHPQQSEPAGVATAKPAQSKPAKPAKTTKARPMKRSVRKARKQAGR